jgi:MSHA biogenesis protein MshG
MKAFNWSGRDGAGSIQKGTESAVSADDLAGNLSRRGVVPLSIEAQDDEKATTAFFHTLFARNYSVSPDLVLLCRQMATITKAGVPLLRGVRSIAAGVSDPRLRTALFTIAESLASGESLATTLTRFPALFDRLFVAMIRVGEAGGGLDRSFQELERNLKRELSTIKKVKSAVRYPTFVVVAMAIALVVINITVIPAFSTVFARFGTDLPLLTRVLVFVSDLTVSYWGLWLALLGVGFVGLRLYLSTDRGQMFWGQWKLRLPIVGPLFMCASLERYTRCFSILIRAGVPLTELVSLCAVATDNLYLKARVELIRTGLESGESFVIAHDRAEFFPPLVVQMLAVGEESGRLDDLLEEVSHYYEEELDFELEKLSARIEPILVVSLAAMVTVLALGIFLPIWQLYELQLQA